MIKSPLLTISLDFELLWGIFEKAGDRINSRYFENTRKVIPQMLDAFVENGVEVTWATVGMLFANDEEEWRQYQPEDRPTYKDKRLSAYEWVKHHGMNPVHHFAPDLIKLIIDAPGQELASHTFSHYYTLMRGQTPEQFRMDLRAAQQIAKDKFQVSLSSLVFPRNHLNYHYLQICTAEGFDQVRGNPENWFWQETQKESLLKKVGRTADCFIPMGKRTSYSMSEISKDEPDYPWIIPASRLLRPHYGKGPFVDRIRLHRVKEEMTEAARHGEVYHLWWHPHNFGNYPEECMRELKEIIQHFRQLQQEYGMQACNMQNLAKLKG